MSNTNHGICTSNYKIGVRALVSVHNTLNVSNKIFHLEVIEKYMQISVKFNMFEHGLLLATFTNSISKHAR